MQYKIHGNVTQTVDFLLNQGEGLFTENGNIAWMRGDIRLTLPPKSTGSKLLGKKGGAESVSKVGFACYSPKCLLVFSPEIAGSVVDITLEEGQSILCQKNSLLCAEGSMDIQPFFQQKLTPAFGDGFILYQIVGPGTIFLHIPGDLREYELRQGEFIKVDPGHLAALEPTVRFEISQGDFLVANLNGPGRVWLQTLSIPNMTETLNRLKSGK